jgi:hypothetical protein
MSEGWRRWRVSRAADEATADALRTGQPPSCPESEETLAVRGSDLDCEGVSPHPLLFTKRRLCDRAFNQLRAFSNLWFLWNWPRPVTR